jgi:hypothetical protein
LTVLRNHLQSHHAHEYAESIAIDEEKKRQRNEKKIQQAFDMSMKKDKKKKSFMINKIPESAKYHPDHHRQKLLDKNVAAYVGATNVPFSVVENEHFCVMLSNFEPHYRMPSRTRLMSTIDEIIQSMKYSVKCSMAVSRKIHFCADIWSKKGLTSSYLGVTAHYYSPIDQNIHHPTIAVRQLRHPHTGEAIKELLMQIIEEWGIPNAKLGFIVTDNGSNMIKAFKNVQAVKQTLEDEDIDVDDIELDGEVDANMTDQEVSEFDGQEITHMDAFRKSSLHRLSCFSHTVQLVVSSFNKDEGCKELLSKSMKVVRSVCKSSKATEALINASGRKLVSSCATRWSTAYLVVHRLIEVKDSLPQVLLDHGLQMLQPEDWENLNNVDTLLQDFAEYTDIAGGESYITLSAVIPYYLALKLHLQTMATISSITEVASMLLTELERRFSKLIDFQHVNHDPIYIVATMLDPRFKIALDPEQIQYARKECLKMLLPDENISSGDDDNAGDSLAVHSAVEADTEEPKAKRPKVALKSLDAVLSQPAHSIKGSSKRNRHLPEIQLDVYLQTTEGEHRPLDLDVIKYWNSSSLTILAPFAIDVLAAPSSSTAVGRTFSTAGEATAGRRNRLTGENLEKEILLKKNKQYYMSMFWE